MKTVVFACVHNAGRSQMAAAWFNQLADPLRARAVSAGTRPADRVHPVVIEVMLEVGIDLTSMRPQHVRDTVASDTAMLITMGCGDECPVVAGAPREDWPLDDAKGKPLVRVRELRDQIRTRVVTLLAANGWAR